jgi:hypothetical protein
MARKIKRKTVRKRGYGRVKKRTTRKRGGSLKSIWNNHKGKILAGAALAAVPLAMYANSRGSTVSLPAVPTTPHRPSRTQVINQLRRPTYGDSAAMQHKGRLLNLGIL